MLRRRKKRCGQLQWLPQSRGICISHTAHTLDEIYGWNPSENPDSMKMKRLETSGKTTGAGTVQRSLTWSDLMHQTEWPDLVSSLATTSYQNMTCIEPIWTLASFAGNVHNQHNLAIVLVQGHILSVDVLHREVVDAVTRHFLRRPRPLCAESANGSRRCIHLYAALLCIYAPFSHTCRNPLTKLGGIIGIWRVLLSSYLFDSFSNSSSNLPIV